MDTLGWILFGLFTGVIARWITPGRAPGGCVVTILLGISGALLAGYVGRIAGFYGPGEQAGFLAAILGAVGVLIVYSALVGRDAK